MVTQKTPNLICGYCETPFYRRPSKIKETKSGLYFCSREHQGFGYRKHSGIAVTSGPVSSGNYKPAQPYSCLKCGKITAVTREHKTFCSDKCKIVYVTNLTHKKCSKCNNVKSVDFFIKAETFDTYSAVCNECVGERWQLWYTDSLDDLRSANAERNRKWAASEQGKHSIFLKRLRRYNLTEKEYNDLYEACNGICPICSVKKVTAIDHDHKTGKVRGLLCHDCNRGLGIFKDDVNMLAKAAKYLLQ